VTITNLLVEQVSESEQSRYSTEKRIQSLSTSKHTKQDCLGLDFKLVPSKKKSYTINLRVGEKS